MYAHRESRARWLLAPRAPTRARMLALDAEGQERPKGNPPLRRRRPFAPAFVVPG